MSELTPWESVHQVQPTDALLALVGKENSFTEWPPAAQWIVLGSMQLGVGMGLVAADFRQAIVGTISFSPSGLELRARWEPSK